MSHRHFRTTPGRTLQAVLALVGALLASPPSAQTAAAPAAAGPAVVKPRPAALAPLAGIASRLRTSEHLSAIPAASASRAPTPAQAETLAQTTAQGPAQTPNLAPNLAPTPAATPTPLVKLGLGDTISLTVFGKPDLSTKAVVADDGTVQLPLIGPIRVVGLSPSEAAQRVTQAYLDGEFLVNPQVTIALDNGTSQQVSVLGEVGTPGRYPVESRTSVFDLLAIAGGKTADSADVLYLVRTEADGTVSRMPIDLSSLADPSKEFPSIKFQGGDTIYVPRAPQVFIYGEVARPGEYRLQPGMSLIEALTIAGGVTRRGSLSRIEIKRKKPDGKFMSVYPKLNDILLADDVIRVKESIF